MSQIDKVIYLPILSWYWILFILLYFVIFTFFLGSFAYAYRTRVLFFEDVLISGRNSMIFIENFKYVLLNSKRKNSKLICFRR